MKPGVLSESKGKIDKSTRLQKMVSNDLTSRDQGPSWGFNTPKFSFCGIRRASVSCVLDHLQQLLKSGIVFDVKLFCKEHIITEQ